MSRMQGFEQESRRLFYIFYSGYLVWYSLQQKIKQNFIAAKGRTCWPTFITRTEIWKLSHIVGPISLRAPDIPDSLGSLGSLDPLPLHFQFKLFLLLPLPSSRTFSWGDIICTNLELVKNETNLGQGVKVSESFLFQNVRGWGCQVRIPRILTQPLQVCIGGSRLPSCSPLSTHSNCYLQKMHCVSPYSCHLTKIIIPSEYKHFTYLQGHGH